MSVLRTFPRPIAVPVPQKELRGLIAMYNARRRFDEFLEQKERQVLEGLLQGRPVEPGAHEAWVEEEWRGGVRKQKLKVR